MADDPVIENLLPDALIPADCLWSGTELHQAITLFTDKVRHFSLIDDHQLPVLPEASPDEVLMADWLDAVTHRSNLDFKETEATYPDLIQLLRKGAPFLMQVPNQQNSAEKSGFLLVVKSNAKYLSVLQHDGCLKKLAINDFRDFFVATFDGPLMANLRKISISFNHDEQQQENIFHALLTEQLQNAVIRGIWLIRFNASGNFIKQMFYEKIPAKVAWVMVGSIILSFLSLVAWVLVSRSSLDGGGGINLQIWGLLLITLIPLQVNNSYIQNRISLNSRMFIRTHLLKGVFKLKPEEVQKKGSSYFFSVLMNMELIEANSLGTAFGVLMAIVQLGIAITILTLGSGSMFYLYLVIWLALIGFLVLSYYRRMKSWNDQHQHMSNDLIERMSGHRTRLVQEPLSKRHASEDQILSKYALLSVKMDQINALLDTIASRRGWLAFSLIVLANAYLYEQDFHKLLICIGGIFFAASAFDLLKSSLKSFLSVVICWQQLGEIYNAGKQKEKPPRFHMAKSAAKRTQSQPIIEGKNIQFAYAGSSRNILSQLNLEIFPGDRILLEGASGSGKSTLALLLAGVVHHDAGTLKLMGRQFSDLSLKMFKRHVVIAPQFHSNHIVSDTFAFNLLMGRNWPPGPQDLQDAHEICKELKLDTLLETMPAGMQQMIGEAGWRLSHGEKSRLFIARTLLQNADLIVLDESFAALDPDTLKSALGCVMKRSNALLLIAHP